MTNPFQQQTRLRKLIYTALILALFTGSLMHRRFVVAEQARDLQLLETSRGEVELASSAVRQVLWGSRGFAVTVLWKMAIDEQARHKWNEVELLVGSITRLQPYFITPWLFQSWNMSFNVAVECDKPRDKYYYVSRGLQLLAEGERRNQGLLDREGRPRFPGNPDMRFHMGFTYQLKIGTSDEQNAMQCLLEMSTIDPIDRDPETMWAPGKEGREVNLKRFEKFCRDHPRLVRRLSNALDYNSPKEVVAFLKDNQVIPTRFSDQRNLADQASELLDVKAQFPVLPPKVADSRLPVPLQGYWPDAVSPALTAESLDVFLIGRTWFSYAQLPLPPAYADIGAVDPPIDILRHRLPKHMTTIIFRGYPCLGQQFIAEHLQKEGWFDADGWTIKDWFEPILGGGDELRVGVEPKYHSGSAWKKAYQLYRDHGLKNGLYISPELRGELSKKAEAFRKKHRVRPGERADLRQDIRVGAMGESYAAHQKLAWNDHYRQLTNFDSHLNESEAEQDPRAVQAHKWLFEAKQAARSGANPQALGYYEQALPIWLDLFLDYPRFRRVSSTQENVYEAQLKYLRLLQREKAGPLRTAAMIVAQLGCWPNWPPFDQPFANMLNEGQRLAIIPMRMFHGPLDRTMIFDVDFMLTNRFESSQDSSYDKEFKQALMAWSQHALPFPVYLGTPSHLLTQKVSWPGSTYTDGWVPLISPSAIDVIRGHMGLPSMSERRPPTMPAMMPGKMPGTMPQK